MSGWCGEADSLTVWKRKDEGGGGWSDQSITSSQSTEPHPHALSPWQISNVSPSKAAGSDPILFSAAFRLPHSSKVFTSLPKYLFLNLISFELLHELRAFKKVEGVGINTIGFGCYYCCCCASSFL